jgi:hypothetical protein
VFPACSGVQYTASDQPGLGHFAALLPIVSRWVAYGCCRVTCSALPCLDTQQQRSELVPSLHSKLLELCS